MSYYLKIGEYVKQYGSKFLYILYNGHIAEYDSIQSLGIRNNIDDLCFCIEEDIHKFQISMTEENITLINILQTSKGFFCHTWKGNYNPCKEINRYRYWDRILPDGTRQERESIR